MQAPGKIYRGLACCYTSEKGGWKIRKKHENLLFNTGK